MVRKEELAIIVRYYFDPIIWDDSVHIAKEYFGDNFEFEPYNILFANSIFGDDVNSLQYPKRGQEFLDPNKMGGFDGYLREGLTGIKSTISHIQGEGAVLKYDGHLVGNTHNDIRSFFSIKLITSCSN